MCHERIKRTDDVSIFFPSLFSLFGNNTHEQKTKVSVWLYQNSSTRIQGTIIGFDEFMNVVLDGASEVGKDRQKPLGRILLKGENISLIQPLQ